MENSFLENLGRYITEFYGDDTGRLCVVLPNKRAGLFLERALSSLLESPSWSPEVFSVEELINDISGLTPADQAEQLVLFYSVYKKAEKEKAEPFELFSKWAPTLLNDFNEADMYLADTEKLFGNLAEIKSIENWSLGAEELTEFQKEYVRFWSNIGRWHRVYRDLLLREKKAYPGMMYRHVADNIAQLFPQGKWKKIIFAGFNALSAAEEKIISVLRQNRQADVLWDADRYYLEDPMQEAGKFLRAHREHLFRPLPGETASFTHVSDHFLSDEKKITVIGAAKNVSQARAAGWFLQTIPEGERFTPSTAIVLADEQLLFPVLSALPAGDDPVNITMGFPMKNSGAALFFSALFSLHETAQRFGITSRKGNRKYYHEDVIRLLKHPYTKELFPGSRFTAELENMIRRMNLIFLSVEQLDLLNGFEDEKQIFSVFFEPWENGHDALSRTEAIIFLLQNAFSGEQEEKMNTEREYLFRVHVMLNRVRSLADRLGDENSIHTTRAFFEQQMNSATLPFSGEPLGGLQIMGLLETRTLDFRNVILLSANENILPAGKSQQSFIVHDLRRAFGLPLWNEKDAVTAYHFYRLLQRAKNICLIYNTDQDTFGIREKSRFVLQLENELTVKNPKVKISSLVFDAGMQDGIPPPHRISVPKSGAILDKLHQLGESGFSPSALNAYRTCGLRFYFHYIAGIREPDEIEEEAEDRLLGTIIHEALEELYRPLTEKKLSAADFEAVAARTEKVCEKIFSAKFPSEDAMSGKNLLAQKIAVRHITQLLNREKKSFDTEHAQILALEKEFSAPVTFGKTSVVIRGKADRIDKGRDAVTLIDYKSGKTEQRELKFSDWAELQTESGIGKSFQLLTYAWLFRKNDLSGLPVRSGIISFRKMSEGLMTVNAPEGELLTGETEARFESALRGILEHLFSSDEELSQTPDEQNCRSCPYNAVCRRV